MQDIICFRINGYIGPKLPIWGAQSTVGINFITCFLIQENISDISIIPERNKGMNKIASGVSGEKVHSDS